MTYSYFLTVRAHLPSPVQRLAADILSENSLREFAYVYARIALTARNRRRAVPTDLESRTNFQPFDWGHGMIGEIEMMAGGISLHRERGAAPCRW